MTGWQRIEGRYEVDGAGCWVWQRCRDQGGYGRLTLPGKKKAFAHRVAYEAHIGPIPAGLEIDHLCKNRACVNPEHLEAVDRATNVRRSRLTTMTWEKVREIRVSSERGGELAARFGVTPASISQIRRSVTWKEA